SVRMNTTGVSYTTGSADFAEYYASAYAGLNTGDLVGLNQQGKAVRATTGTPIVGVISETAGVIGNDTEHIGNDNKVIVGLMGQLPLKVSVANGTIAAGDPLTSSSVPGVAVKATGAAQIVGYALTGTSVDGTVQISLNVSWYAPS